MDVNYGHYMTTVLTNLMLHGETEKLRKAVRRVLNIPYDIHNNLITLLVSNTLPFFDEICKRSARFILSCIQSESSFVRSTVRYGILSVVVILLLVEMSCFYAHVSNGSLMISSVAMLVLIMSFCIIFIVVLGMMIGLLLSS